MIRNILCFTVLLVLVAFVGTACKKKADGGDDKSYLTDQITPNDGTKPDINQNPCLQKGAVGAMGLMLKADCDGVKPTVAVCGNTITESGSGEECDDGNSKNGDGCSSACKKEGKKPIPDGAVAITTAENDAQFSKCTPGKDCTIKITAEGMKGNKYDWSVVSAPASFKATPSNSSSYSLKGTNVPYCDANAPKYDAKNCTITVKVCPKGDSVASNCDTGTFVLTIVERLVITASAKNSTALTCDKTGCVYKPEVKDFLDAAFTDSVNHKDYGTCVWPDCEPAYNNEQALLKAWKALELKVTGTLVPDSIEEKYDKDKQTYKWTVVDGNTDALHSESIIWPEGQSWDVAFPEEKNAIFVMGDDSSYLARFFGDNSEEFIPWDVRYLMVRPGTEDKTYDLKITVTSPHSTTTLPLTVTIPNGVAAAILKKETEIADAAKKAQEKLDAACSNLKVGSLTIGLPWPVNPSVAGDTYTFNVTSLTVDTPSMAATLNVSGGSGKYLVKNVVAKNTNAATPQVRYAAPNNDINKNMTISKVSAEKPTIEWPDYTQVVPTTTDTTEFDVVDVPEKSSECTYAQTVHVQINRKATYPELATLKVADLKMISYKVQFDYVDGSSQYKLELLDAKGMSLTEQSWQGADDKGDPGTFQTTGTLVETAYSKGLNADSGATFADVKHVRMHLKEGSTTYDMDCKWNWYSIETKYWTASAGSPGNVKTNIYGGTNWYELDGNDGGPDPVSVNWVAKPVVVLIK